MEGTITSSPLLRFWVVAVPGLLFATVLGIQLGEGNSVVGVAVLALAVGFVIAISLTRRGVLEGAILGCLIIGYFVGNRGFAQLAVVRPLFVGELALAALAFLVGMRALVTRDFPSLKIPLVGLIAAYLLYAVVRFAFDVRQYRFDAIRDLAVVYYAAFFFIAYQVGGNAATRQFFERCIGVAVALQAVITLVYTVRPEFLQTSFVIRGAPLFFQKGDLTMTFAAVGIFFLANRTRIAGLKWLRVALLIVLALCAALSIVRAALLALACGSLLLFLAGQRRVFVFLGGGIVAAAIAVMFVTAAGGSVADSPRILHFKDKIASMVDLTGRYEYQTDLGTMKGDNNEFRRTFWKVMATETTKSNPLFGKGFGYNFLPQFEAYYARGSWEGLRSPHNYYVTVYGRMGAVGLLIFLGITFVIMKNAVRAALLVRAGRLAPADFSYWCAAVVLLVSATFGVVLEGPMGAIPFWTFLGLAARQTLKPPPAAAADSAALTEERREPPLTAASPAVPHRRRTRRPRSGVRV